MCQCGLKTKLFLIAIALAGCQSTQKLSQIDRFALVNRHNVVVEAPDTLASLSVGNGDFAFTADITGLQTFYTEYERGVTLGTQSNWGWHTFPNTANYTEMESAKYWDYRGRQVPYWQQPPATGAMPKRPIIPRKPAAFATRVIRLLLKKADGTEVKLATSKSPDRN
jgi:hypothetical protein